MHGVLLLGAGKIGRMIAKFLVGSGDYDVLVADHDRAALDRAHRQSSTATATLDATNRDELARLMRGRQAVISALSFRFNPLVAEVARDQHLSYFDLTEDVETTAKVRRIAEQAKAGQIFVPQCGLAPGFISIVASRLTKEFDTLDRVHLRVGALPQFPTNALKYNLTWSTDGLINEYCNPCQAIHLGRMIEALPLEGLEEFSLDGLRYEAFNTSGGVGTLCETLDGKVQELNYKTIRYVGHRDLACFLVNELRMNQRREMLKDILESAIPVTFQDVVVIFCTITGQRKGQLVQMSDARKVYSQSIDGESWSAIQITTAAGICAALDLHATGRLTGTGFVRQEQIDLEEFLRNRFGRHYDVSPARTEHSRRIAQDAASETVP